jgi:hypothetical protein
MQTVDLTQTRKFHRFQSSMHPWYETSIYKHGKGFGRSPYEQLVIFMDGIGLATSGRERDVPMIYQALYSDCFVNSDLLRERHE